MRSETYTFTPDAIARVNGLPLEGRTGYIQGYKDERGSFVALLIPCDEDEREGLVESIKGDY